MNNAEKASVLVVVGVCAMLFFIATVVGWYRAGVQAEVYRREGIEMTQWEVFMGAKPAERTVNVR